jgi:transcriptional regulator with XRE-family HTH domain
MVDTIGKRIRDARERYGMSQAELARRVGISANSMNAIERAKVDPKASHITAIARVLKISGDYLLGLRDDEDVSAETETCAVA